ETIADELSAHVILPALDIETYNSLRLELDQLPGLSLKPSLARRYPFGTSASHVIGYVGAVNAEDLEKDPNKDDDLKRYGINDRIGRDGLEKLVEDRLRGSRGILYFQRGTKINDAEQDTPGEDVRTTIDIELEGDIEEAFKHVKFYNPDKSHDELSMNGAAVIIDIPTGQVRALVSVPTYDPNRFEADYNQLIADDLNTPLTNRALMTAIEPGSTVKIIVGLGAIKQGLIGVDSTIECTGHLVLEGKTYARPRCWTMSMFEAAHHTIPSNAPHPTGFLTFSDALERSCNIYFEVLGDRLRLDGLAHWMKEFGLGQPTGIGLSEARGAVPKVGRYERSESWYAAIGQGPVLATPIQMANVAATIARDGKWMRPTLVVDNPPDVFDSKGKLIPREIDLHLPKPALAAARRGMTAVVNSPAGTGDSMQRSDLLVAAKTGSASATKLTRYERDQFGNRILDENGKPLGYEIEYGSRENPNPEIAWYRASDIDAKTGKARGTHGWTIGFAPA
ncbi:MAG TPA: penicillin-binding transpeptidase domain-containing protein, partial [Tepidisphaeraceae bacterium]|nr:penicillin-binding transpeptidase domain-containing protein [Tepidisphaeraceae bacterium]